MARQRARSPLGRSNGRESCFARYQRQMNAIKDAIKSGRTVVGTTAGSNVDVSILADAGYDFLLFDTQHSAWDQAAATVDPDDARQAGRAAGARRREPGLSNLLRA